MQKTHHISWLKITKQRKQQVNASCKPSTFINILAIPSPSLHGAEEVTVGSTLRGRTISVQDVHVKTVQDPNHVGNIEESTPQLQTCHTNVSPHLRSMRQTRMFDYSC